MPRPLHEQVVVITGASSGIGREAALRFGRSGARVVLAARHSEALEALAADIRADGGQALAVPTDVAELAEVEALAARAVERFGRIDTWVNNAAASVYGAFEVVPLDEMRRVMDVTYWGCVHGFRAALPRMKAQGGTIITVGSVECEVAMPLQSAYGAAKHALRGLVETIRIELMHDGVPIAVPLIKPPSVDTPFYDTAKSRMGVAPRPVPPVYDPAVIAREIVRNAKRPQREVLVGGAAQALAAAHVMAPALTDRLFATLAYPAQQSSEPRSPDAPSSLSVLPPRPEAVRRSGRGWKTSWVMWLEEHPTASLAGLALGGVAATAWASRRR